MRRGEMEKDGYFLRADDRGASLIAVVVALVFVVTMGAVITEITTTNIRMRDVELSGKKNFYNAEEVMDELKLKMAEVAAEEMQEVYRDMLSRYSEILSYGTSAEEDELQKFSEMLHNEFKHLYMDKLVARFRDKDKSEEETKTGDGSVVYIVGNYNVNVINPMLSDLNDLEGVVITFQAAGDNPVFTADYEEGLFTLKNLKIEFTDERDYETWITTDLVFDTPMFQFDDGTSQSFMNYALIADSRIDVDTGNYTVNGSVYAGTGGIVSEYSGTADFSGDNIVTRGDIVVKNTSTLTFGESSEFTGTTHIWAQNVRTEDKYDPTITTAGPVLKMNGEINIEDDLALNGTNSNVQLIGSYNGYNFREDYSKEGKDISNTYSPEKDPLFSSAIMINGENCSLDLQGLNHLFLAGRAFISRGKNLATNSNNDILLGESLSVRSDQLAYLVSERDLVKDGSGDVKLLDGSAKFTPEAIQKYRLEAGVDLEAYGEYILVVPYNYRNNVSDEIKEPATQYYLYFNSAEKANQFFEEYWSTKGDKLAEYGKEYAEAIRLNNNTVLTLSGYLLYQDSSVTENEGFIPIRGENAENGWDNISSIYWDRSDMLARTYKSLQEDLAGVYTLVAPEKVRFYDGSGNVDKEQNPLFENLINTVALKGMEDFGDLSEVDVEEGEKTEISGNDWKIVLRQNDKSKGLGDAYVIPNELTGGIIIATGDVIINADFKGMVISGGTIRLVGNANVTGDANLVKRIFNEVKGKVYGSQFAEIFRGYQHSDTAGVSSGRIGDYLFYENWTKNEE